MTAGLEAPARPGAIRRNCITLWASILALRASGAVAETFGVSLNDDYRETIRHMAEVDEVIEAHGGWPDAFVARKA